MGQSLQINQHSTMKAAILALFCVALVASQDVPDLCQPCIRILTEANYPDMIACLEKDLVDKQICFKGGQICIEVDATVEETINLAISPLRLIPTPLNFAPWLESVVITKCLELSRTYFYKVCLKIK